MWKFSKLLFFKHRDHHFYVGGRKFITLQVPCFHVFFFRAHQSYSFSSFANKLKDFVFLISFLIHYIMKVTLPSPINLLLTSRSAAGCVSLTWGTGEAGRERKLTF